MRNKRYCVHVLIDFYLTLPSNKQIICFDFKKLDSAVPYNILYTLFYNTYITAWERTNLFVLTEFYFRVLLIFLKFWLFLPEIMYICSESSGVWLKHMGCSMSGFVDGVGDDDVARVVASDGGEREEGG